MTYTFADIDYCYCMLFQYDTDEELKTINDSIEKIEINPDFWDIFVYLFKCAPFYWFCFLLICLICGVVLWGEGIGELIGLIVCACVVLLATLWGEWLWFLLAAATVNILIVLSPIVMFLLKIFSDD